MKWKQHRTTTNNDKSQLNSNLNNNKITTTIHHDLARARAFAHYMTYTNSEDFIVLQWNVHLCIKFLANSETVKIQTCTSTVHRITHSGSTIFNVLYDVFLFSHFFSCFSIEINILKWAPNIVWIQWIITLCIRKRHSFHHLYSPTTFWKIACVCIFFFFSQSLSNQKVSTVYTSIMNFKFVNKSSLELYTFRFKQLKYTHCRFNIRTKVFRFVFFFFQTLGSLLFTIHIIQFDDGEDDDEIHLNDFNSWQVLSHKWYAHELLSKIYFYIKNIFVFYLISCFCYSLFGNYDRISKMFHFVFVSGMLA